MNFEFSLKRLKFIFVAASPLFLIEISAGAFVIPSIDFTDAFLPPFHFTHPMTVMPDLARSLLLFNSAGSGTGGGFTSGSDNLTNQLWPRCADDAVRRQYLLDLSVLAKERPQLAPH